MNLFFVYNIIKIYTYVRYIHGIYVSYFFLKWLIFNLYGGFNWILSFIPKPLSQIKNKNKYYSIDINDYVYIEEILNI